MLFKLNVHPTLLILPAVLLLSACTQQATLISATTKEAFFGLESVDLNKEQLSAIPYASQYVIVNDTQRVLMVLAFAETNPDNGHHQLKWVSSDYAMIVTENGVITKTLNLPTDNVVRTISSGALTNSLENSRYDWPKNGLFSVPSQSSLTSLETESMQSTLWSKELTHWQEHVRFTGLDSSITNDYWLDNDGAVYKSIQYLGPKMTKIEMEVAKPFVNTEAPL